MGQVRDMLHQKINTRLDALKVMLEEQMHLSDPDKVLECIGSVSKFWSVLYDDEKFYIERAEYAIKHKIGWMVL